MIIHEMIPYGSRKDKRMKKYIAYTLIGLSLLSMFLWAGFDIKWWMDDTSCMGLRSMALFLMHVAFLVCSIGFLITSED